MCTLKDCEYGHQKTIPFKINDLQTKKCLNVYTVTHMYRMMFKQLTPKLKFQYGR
jgi:hypothetical protein